MLRVRTVVSINRFFSLGRGYFSELDRNNFRFSLGKLQGSHYLTLSANSIRVASGLEASLQQLCTLDSNLVLELTSHIKCSPTEVRDWTSKPFVQSTLLRFCEFLQDNLLGSQRSGLQRSDPNTRSERVIAYYVPNAESYNH